MTEPIVYVVSKVRQWEGAEVIGVFLSFEAAKVYARKQISLDHWIDVQIASWIDDNQIEESLKW